MLIARGFGQHMTPGINLLLQVPQIHNRKGGDIMIKINPLSTLYVGIDVSSKSSYVCALDFYKNKYINSSFADNQPGAEELAEKVLNCLKGHPDLNTVVAAPESTSVYSIHIANYLSSCEELMSLKPYVSVLSPKCTASHKKTFIGLGRSDPVDAFIIADYARGGNIETGPWRGSQFLALKRLTGHRLHLVECMTREKAYLVSNLYLKFSELQLPEKEAQPFCDIYGAASSGVLTEYLSPEEIITSSEEDLVAFLAEKSRNRIKDISRTADLLRKAARDSCRLDRALYEPLNVSVASSFNCTGTFKKEIKAIDTATEKEIKGLNPKAFTILQSTDGIGSVFAGGIIAEIGDISAFKSSDALAKYAGLYWKSNQSGDFDGEDTPMTKAGSRYLRYYPGEAASSMRKHNVEYGAYYRKKYNEVPEHQHKRALALTSRKFVRLVYGLPAKNQLYSGISLDTSNT